MVDKNDKTQFGPVCLHAQRKLETTSFVQILHVMVNHIFNLLPSFVTLPTNILDFWNLFGNKNKLADI